MRKRNLKGYEQAESDIKRDEWKNSSTSYRGNRFY